MVTTSPKIYPCSEHILVKPLTIHIGAEIHGVDLTKPLSSLEVTTIRNALLRWRVIFFRQQYLTHTQHIEFARQFGDPTAGHVIFGGDNEYPELYPVTKHRTALAARPFATRVWTDWHTDVTAAVNPPFASILRAVVVPPYGGDTQWLNMVAAYEALSTPMQTFVNTLRVIHRFKRATDGDNADDYNDMVDSNPIEAEHPMVTVHPETGENALFTNQEFSKSVVGLTPRESKFLLEYLWEHCIRPEFIVRFRWKEGSIAFWDNRTTQHQVVRDVFDSEFDRKFYRVTLNGAIPIGVDGRLSDKLSGESIKAI